MYEGSRRKGVLSGVIVPVHRLFQIGCDSGGSRSARQPGTNETLKTGKMKYPLVHIGSWRIPAMPRTGTTNRRGKVIYNV